MEEDIAQGEILSPWETETKLSSPSVQFAIASLLDVKEERG